MEEVIRALNYATVIIIIGVAFFAMCLLICYGMDMVIRRLKVALRMKALDKEEE